MSELNDEKIDVIKWSPDPAEYIANALSPAKVIMVNANEKEKVARVVVPDNQLSLAIGKEGQNARLTARLTGWKIDIKCQSQLEEQFDAQAFEAQMEEYEQFDAQPFGNQAAWMKNLTLWPLRRSLPARSRSLRPALIFSLI